jgi:serine/alanine adding enzyme
MIPILHTSGFVRQWRKLLVALYGYQADADALLVPGVLGSKTTVYLPLLSYSDLNRVEAKRKISDIANKRYQIRVLDGDCQDFKPNDTVTMRLSLLGRTVDEIFKKVIDPKCRNHIRKSEKMALILCEGTDAKLIADFYAVFSVTMHRHGTPVFSKRLFEQLPQYVKTQYLVAYYEGQPVAGLCLVFDEKLAWVPWAGSLFEHRGLRPNHLLYWTAIQRALSAGVETFDFGRSGYLGPTYDFKADWGALPVKVEVLTSEKVDVYQKYTQAAEVWKKMPKWLVDRIGPSLCKYLPDL